MIGSIGTLPGKGSVDRILIGLVDDVIILLDVTERAVLTVTGLDIRLEIVLM